MSFAVIKESYYLSKMSKRVQLPIVMSGGSDTMMGLGLYRWDTKNKCYKLVSTEKVLGLNGILYVLYVFRGSDGFWYCGPKPGENKGYLMNPSNSSILPLEGWENGFNGQFYSDPSIRIQFKAEVCDRVSIEHCDPAVASRYPASQGIFEITAKFYCGLPVYINSFGWCLYFRLIVWAIGPRIGETVVMSPARRLCPSMLTSWKYFDESEAISTDVIVRRCDDAIGYCLVEDGHFQARKEKFKNMKEKSVKATIASENVPNYKGNLDIETILEDLGEVQLETKPRSKIKKKRNHCNNTNIIKKQNREEDAQTLKSEKPDEVITINDNVEEDEGVTTTSYHEVECIVCSEVLPLVTFLPCFHQIACNECCQKMKKCLFCGEMVKEKKFTEVTGRKEDSWKLKYDTLEMKYDNLEDQMMCTICMHRHKDVAFEGCGHQACQKCSNVLNTCHMCRQPIQKKIKLYN